MKKILTTLILLTLLAAPAWSQAKRVVAPELRFTDMDASYGTEGVLRLSFRLKVRGDIVHATDALHLVPIFTDADGREMELPRIILNGRSRAGYHRREVALMDHDEYDAFRPNVVVTLDGKVTEVTVPYEFELKGVRSGTLRIDQYLEDCCDIRLLGSKEVQTAQRMPPEEPSPAPRSVGMASVFFVRPAEETRKLRADSVTVRIQFVVARHDIDPVLGRNASELRKVDDLLRDLRADSRRYHIETSTILGYASPEGTYDSNLALSQRRADSFKSFLERRYRLTDITAMGMGEDWQGLRRAVDRCRMPWRDEVLAIIDFTDLFRGREKKLMDLQGGMPYKWMLQNLYPPLRRMQMKVSYEVEAIDERDRAAVYGTRPQDLSEAELFALGMSRSVDTPTFGDELLLAAKYFPQSLTARINASSIALLRGNTEEAWQLLQPIQGAPEAQNNLGVYHYLRGDDRRAAEFWRKALALDPHDKVANFNLNHLANK